MRTTTKLLGSVALVTALVVLYRRRGDDATETDDTIETAAETETPP